mgnify:CR=1 FL=1
MSFFSLPADLQNLVTAFCWEISAKRLERNLKTCEEVQKWKLHPVFLKSKVWCNHKMRHTSTPLVVFRPIVWFGNSWKSIFDWNAVFEVLYRLDFRKNAVREIGTRADWVERLKNWRNILYFDGFFTLMMYEPNPTYKQQRFTALNPFRF